QEPKHYFGYTTKASVLGHSSTSLFWANKGKPDRSGDCRGGKKWALFHVAGASITALNTEPSAPFTIGSGALRCEADAVASRLHKCSTCSIPSIPMVLRFNKVQKMCV